MRVACAPEQSVLGALERSANVQYKLAVRSEIASGCDRGDLVTLVVCLEYFRAIFALR